MAKLSVEELKSMVQEEIGGFLDEADPGFGMEPRPEDPEVVQVGGQKVAELWSDIENLSTQDAKALLVKLAKKVKQPRLAKAPTKFTPAQKISVRAGNFKDLMALMPSVKLVQKLKGADKAELVKLHNIAVKTAKKVKPEQQPRLVRFLGHIRDALDKPKLDLYQIKTL